MRNTPNRPRLNGYDDARETLRIANMAYAAGAYDSAYELLDILSGYLAYDNARKTLTEAQYDSLCRDTQRAIGELQYCPDEYWWEVSGNLMDRFR